MSAKFDQRNSLGHQVGDSTSCRGLTAVRNITAKGKIVTTISGDSSSQAMIVRFSLRRHARCSRMARRT